MHPAVIQQLLDLNNTFYQTFGRAFAITRRRIQPGIARCLAELDAAGDWLDLGCGSGATAAAWAKTPGRQGRYVGIDFSPVLLEEARRAVQVLAIPGIDIDLCQAELTSAEWKHCLESDSPAGGLFDVISAFAVLHHIPGEAIRRQLFDEIRAQLKPQGTFILSVWQFQHSPRLMERRLPWETVHLSAEQVDAGDALLDWRFSTPEQAGQAGADGLRGYRYVHLFSPEELGSLAGQTGFEVVRSFESDGKGGRLGLYLVLKKAEAGQSIAKLPE